MKLFYDHLTIHLNDVYAEIERLEIKTKEKKELVKLVDETTHHKVFNTILKALDNRHHQSFLKKFHQAPHDPKVLSFLKDKIEDIEDVIQATSKKLKKSLLNKMFS